jgi:regulator of sigma E protease
MNPEELEGLEPEVARRAYYAQSPWKRIVVILAGPGVNIVIAFVLFWAILVTGNLNGVGALESINPSIPTLTPMVKSVESGHPAAGALRPGDRIVAAEGRPATFASTIQAVNAHRCAGSLVEGCRAATPVHLTVLRAGHRVTLSIYPRYNTRERRMLIGFHFDAAARSFGPLNAASTALDEMWHSTTHTLTGFADALTSSKARKEVSSIVGITRVGHETVAAGTGYALVFLGYLSLVLAVINLFPFLPLDGGHIAWSLAEKVRGRRVSLMAMYRYSSVGILLLLFLVINGVSNDINRLTG